MSWAYLVIAGLFEIAWPIGLKLAQVGDRRAMGIALAVAGMAASGLFLYLAQREIAIGTAYAVWTGIGAAGTVLLGIALFDEPATLARLACIGLIVAGIVGLKLAGS